LLVVGLVVALARLNVEQEAARVAIGAVLVFRSLKE
jgi:hypothetical protein